MTSIIPQKYIFAENNCMITIISGTNRKDAETIKVARNYQRIMSDNGIENQIFDLTEFPLEAFNTSMYAEKDDKIVELYDKYIKPVNKYVFIVPEYNGSFPGIVKLLIDVVPPSHFHNTKAGIVGLSAGRAGNLRGMEHLTGVLNYLQVSVLFSKPKLSSIENLLDKQGNITDEFTLGQLEKHVNLMAEF